MNQKLQRVSREIEKTQGKIALLQGKMRELEKERIQLENLEIVDTVRGLNISLSDLETLLKSKQHGGSN